MVWLMEMSLEAALDATAVLFLAYQGLQDRVFLFIIIWKPCHCEFCYPMRVFSFFKAVLRVLTDLYTFDIETGETAAPSTSGSHRNSVLEPLITVSTMATVLQYFCFVFCHFEPFLNLPENHSLGHQWVHFSMKVGFLMRTEKYEKCFLFPFLCNSLP